MTTLGQRLKELRKERGKTQAQIGKLLNVSNVSVSGYENDTREPDSAALKKLSDYYGVSIDYLLGNTDKPHYYSLTEKDQQDIDTELENMLNGVSKNGGINYFQNGAQISEQDRELLKASMRQTIALSKELAKKKFTPKKYRGSEQ